MPIFSSVRKKIEKIFWDMEIIGNRRKRKHFIGKRKVKLGFEISHPKVNLQNQHMTTRPS